MNIYINRPFHRPNFKIIGGEEVLASLRLQFGSFAGECPVEGAYEIDVTRRDGGYLIRHSDTEIFSREPLFELDDIFFNMTEYDESVLALHGAAVEWQGKAYIFLAATESGKTTLTTFLISEGFGYITDDCVLIGRENFLVYPYSRPLQLRKGGYDALAKLGKIPYDPGCAEDEIIQRFIFTPNNRVSAPLPIGGVYFIRRSETESARIPLSTNEKMAELMKSPITQYGISPEYLRLLGRLTRLNCEKLVYSDMDFVAETIRRAGDNYG